MASISLAISASGLLIPMRACGVVPRRAAVPGLARIVAPLRCMKADEEHINSFCVDYSSDEYDLKNEPIEVIQWESGMSFDAIAELQGIKIRRHRPLGYQKDTDETEESTQPNILQEIILHKCHDVSKWEEETPLNVLRQALKDAPPARDFLGALEESYARNNMPALIAEVKKASPSRGVLKEDFDPVQIAKAYERHGAACISVLTDKFFRGSFEHLEAIRNSGVKCPLLCKDFMLENWQLYYARLKGADAVLLMAGVLPNLDITNLNKLSWRLGLAAIVEVHTEREMDRVLGIKGIKIIGINNRDLETFEVDISNTRKLLTKERCEIIRQKGIFLVAESGFFTPNDIAYVHDFGIKAVLVGESLITKDDPGKAISGLFGQDLSVQLQE